LREKQVYLLTKFVKLISKMRQSKAIASSGIGGVFGELSASTMTSHLTSGVVPVLLVSDLLGCSSEVLSLVKAFLPLYVAF